MKKFLSKTFVDFKGIERTVVVCIKTDDKFPGYFLGWACRNPVEEKDDIQLAKYIAENRASYKINEEALNNDFNTSESSQLDISKYIIKNPSNYIGISHPGFIAENEDTFTDYILDIYITYLINNPGIMIKGYKYQRNKYQEEKDAVETIDCMTPLELMQMETLATASKNQINIAKMLYKYYNKYKSDKITNNK